MYPNKHTPAEKLGVLQHSFTQNRPHYWLPFCENLCISHGLCSESVHTLSLKKQAHRLAQLAAQSQQWFHTHENGFLLRIMWRLEFASLMKVSSENMHVDELLISVMLSFSILFMTQ